MATQASPKISLCMVVRDEEDRLARCLEAARPAVDEIVVVDTGSTDSTREIAAKFGARVVDFPWCDDFSAARNRSLEEATGAWALVLDADEVLSRRAARELRKATRRKNLLGVYFPLRDKRDDGTTAVSLMFRAFRIRPDIRWRYRVHEQVLMDANRVARKEKLRFLNASGEISHDGYLTEIVEARGKNDRNRRLYEAQLADTPDDLYMLYKYGDFMRRFPEERETSAKVMEKAYERLVATPEQDRRDFTFSGEICALVALARLEAGDDAAAIEICEYGIASCRPGPNLFYVHGHALLTRKLGEAAEAAFRRCLSFHGKPLLVAARPRVTGLGSRLGLARALALQGQIKPAATEAWEALQKDQEDHEAVVTWMDLETLARDWSGTTSRLIQRVRQQPRCGVTWYKGGELFFRLRLFDKALPWIMRAAELMPDPGPVRGLQGECLLAAGFHEPAVDAFTQGLPDLRCRAGLMLMALAYEVAPEEEPDTTDEELVAEVRRMIGNLRELGDRRLSGRLHDALTRLENRDPDSFTFLEKALA